MKGNVDNVVEADGPTTNYNTAKKGLGKNTDYTTESKMLGSGVGNQKTTAGGAKGKISGQEQSSSGSEHQGKIL